MKNVLTVDYANPSAPGDFARSFRETGFAILRNHPVPEALMNRVYDEWRVFFASNEKENFLFNQEKQDGFFPATIAEKAKGCDILDIKEFYHFYLNGRVPEQLKAVTSELFHALTNVAVTLLNWLEQETPEEIASQYSMPLSKMIEGSEKNLLRILHYPPLQGDEPKGAVRAAAHEDINLITVLPASNEPGLQVKDRQGNWHDLPCDHGNLAINSGDMLQMCSRGYYPSTTHRVCNPNNERVHFSRYSTPLFLHPRPEVRLSETHTADDYLKERLRELGLIE